MFFWFFYKSTNKVLLFKSNGWTLRLLSIIIIEVDLNYALKSKA